MKLTDRETWLINRAINDALKPREINLLDYANLAPPPEVKTCEWVSVNDRLPQEGIAVILAGGSGFIKNGTWFTHLEHNGNSYAIIQWEVTHWMAIPIMDAKE